MSLIESMSVGAAVVLGVACAVSMHARARWRTCAVAWQLQATRTQRTPALTIVAPAFHAPRSNARRATADTIEVRESDLL